MAIRLVIVDGHTLTRYGLRELIAGHADIEIVAECGSAAEAHKVVEAAEPDVVTIDSILPDGDGMQLAREFRSRYPRLGIVMLTSRDEDHLLFRALETGVSAFVAKTAPVEETIAAIRHAAVAATSFTASGLAMALGRRRHARERLALSPREAEVLRLLRTPNSDLSPREREVLSLMAHGKTNRDIANALGITEATVKAHMTAILRKLGAANRAQALMTAVQHDLIRYEENPVSHLAPSRAQRAGLLTVAAPRQAASLAGRVAQAAQHERGLQGSHDGLPALVLGAAVAA